MDPSTIQLCNYQIKRNSIRKSRKTKLENLYPVDVQFYKNIPPPIHIENLLNIVTERICALKIINSVVRDIGYKKFDQKCKIATERLKSIGITKYAKLLNSKGHKTSSQDDINDRIIDHTSFVTLHLALIVHAQHQQLYECLRRVEEEFFSLRLSNLDDEGLKELLNIYNKYPKVDDIEKDQLRASLTELLDQHQNYDTTDFYKIPMSVVLGFIDPHKIYFDKGIAFISFNQMTAVLRGLFHQNLEQQSRSINIDRLKHYGKIFDQTRVFQRILEAVYEKFKDIQQYSLRDGTILAADIDKLAPTSFPPCMRLIHETLRDQHHLKHEARLQYTLFLKGIGVPADETIKLFRNEFLKKMTVDTFNKEYRYYIEHAYGFKGKKQDYNPFSCAEIQNTYVPLRDCNGCVFLINNNADIENIDVKLKKWDVSDADRTEMIERAKTGEGGYACAHYFEATNNCALGKSVKHPNQYFRDSRYVLANGLYEHRCEYEHEDDLDIENYSEECYPDISEEYDELTIQQKEANVKLQITVSKRRSISIQMENEPTQISENSTDLNTASEGTGNTVDKTDSHMSTPVAHETARVTKQNMKNTAIPMVSNASTNNQPSNKDCFKAIRKSMAAFDDLIPIENIRPGAVIYFTPRSEASSDSDESLIQRKRKKSR